MDGSHDHQPEDDAPPRRSEAAIRALLERSDRDIAEGRTTPLAPVLDRMRAVAENMRHGRTKKAGTGRRLA